jgi:hypothetical protein
VTETFCVPIGEAAGGEVQKQSYHVGGFVLGLDEAKENHLVVELRYIACTQTHCALCCRVEGREKGRCVCAWEGS